MGLRSVFDESTIAVIFFVLEILFITWCFMVTHRWKGYTVCLCCLLVIIISSTNHFNLLLLLERSIHSSACVTSLKLDRKVTVRVAPRCHMRWWNLCVLGSSVFPSIASSGSWCSRRQTIPFRLDTVCPAGHPVLILIVYASVYKLQVWYPSALK